MRHEWHGIHAGSLGRVAWLKAIVPVGLPPRTLTSDLFVLSKYKGTVEERSRSAMGLKTTELMSSILSCVVL